MLKIINHVFRDFDRNEIKYCHWKSNERLESFLHGKEDLDLLFSPNEMDRVFDILETHGAKRFDALPKGKYSNIFDYLLLDYASGELIHFHIHFGLDIGEKNLKRYRLPFSGFVLESRVRLESNGVWILPPHSELLLLLLRITLRYPPIVSLLYQIGLKSQRIERKALSEFSWLHHRVNHEEFKSLVDNCFDDDSIKSSLIYLFNEGLGVDGIKVLRRSLRSTRRSWATKTDIFVNYSYIASRIRIWAQNTICSRTFDPRKRVAVEEGRKVVIVGSDGAGKSTLVANLQAIFARKVDVASLYLGLPKPSKSNYPSIARIFRKIGLFPVWNFLSKAMNLKRGNRFHSRKGLVFFDRFPQTEFKGLMDAPMLSNWLNSSSIIKRAASRLEEKLFKRISNTEVDLVIKIVVSSEVSAQRGQHPLKMAIRKTEVVKSLLIPKSRRTIEINGDKLSAIEVSKVASIAVWELF